MVNELCIMRRCFNYIGKTRVPTLNKVADRKIISQALVYLLYISNSLKSFKVLKSVSKNSIQSSAILSVPTIRKKPRKWIFQENEYADFTANNAISVFIHK